MKLYSTVFFILLTTSCFAGSFFSKGTYKTKTSAGKDAPLTYTLVHFKEFSDSKIDFEMQLFNEKKHKIAPVDRRTITKDSATGKWSYVIEKRIGKVLDFNVNEKDGRIVSYSATTLLPNKTVFSMINVISNVHKISMKGTLKNAAGTVLATVEGETAPLSEDTFIKLSASLK